MEINKELQTELVSIAKQYNEAREKFIAIKERCETLCLACQKHSDDTNVRFLCQRDNDSIHCVIDEMEGTVMVYDPLQTEHLNHLFSVNDA